MSRLSRSHRNNSSVRSVLPMLAGAVLGLAALARGQSSASLLIKPWEADQTIEDQTAGYIFSAGHRLESENKFHLSTIESEGRVRLFPGKEASPRFGYDLTLLNAHTNRPGFPSQLLDVSVAGGAFVSENNGWITGVTLGLGYAGDEPFARGRAWYGRSDVLVAKKFSATDALGVGIDYDGHRTYGPDIPLPGFAYSHQFDPKFQAVAGFPDSSIIWKPIEHLRIYGNYEFFNDLDADIGYEFVKHWTAFAAFESRRNAFWIQELRDHHRLLYSQRRVELGIRWQPTPGLNFSIAGGYGFSTDFRNGWDYRHSTRYLYASDEPFVRFAAEFRF